MKRVLMSIIILSMVVVGCQSLKRPDPARTEYYGNLEKFKETYCVDNLNQRISTLERVCRIAVSNAKLLREVQDARIKDVPSMKDISATRGVISAKVDSINKLSKTLLVLPQHPDLVYICIANIGGGETCFSFYDTIQHKARFLSFAPPSFIADSPPSYLGARSDYIVNFISTSYPVSFKSSERVQFAPDPKRPDLSSALFKLECMVPSSEGDMVISCCWYWPNRLKKMDNNLAIDLAGIGTHVCFLLSDEEIQQTKPQSMWSIKMKSK